MNKGLVIGIVVIVLALAGGGFYLSTRTPPQSTINNQTITNQTSVTGTSKVEEKSVGQSFQQQKFDNIKTPHFVSSEPDNNEIHTTAPKKVAISFNFNLAQGSKIRVTQDGVDVTTGNTQISADKLTLFVPANLAKTANYKVDYTACWPDGSCHNGSFGFLVNLE